MPANRAIRSLGHPVWPYNIQGLLELGAPVYLFTRFPKWDRQFNWEKPNFDVWELGCGSVLVRGVGEVMISLGIQMAQCS